MMMMMTKWVAFSEPWWRMRPLVYKKWYVDGSYWYSSTHSQHGHLRSVVLMLTLWILHYTAYTLLNYNFYWLVQLLIVVDVLYDVNDVNDFMYLLFLL